MGQLPSRRCPLLIHVEIQSRKDRLRFFRPSSGESIEEIWPILANDVLRTIDPKNHEYNTLLGLLKRQEWKSVIRDLVPIFPGTSWNVETNCLEEPRFTPEIQSTNLNTLIDEASQFFSSFERKRIGVQLSGGLDSSLIIGLLKHLEIPHGLVGLETDRYEFRTERQIQQILAESSDSVALINHDENLPLHRIEDVPAHQYPDLSCNNYASNEAMAQACNELGIEILLTGMGGDIILGGECPSTPDRCDWRLNCFADEWLNEYIYQPVGVTMVPFYGHPSIAKTFFNLRRGQKEDIGKRWGRNYFRKFLPIELTDYTYCADFWGLYIDGLINAVPVVKKLNDRAFDLTGLNYFSETNHQKVFSADLLECEKKTYQRVEARISMAVWLNSLNQDGGVGFFQR